MVLEQIYLNDERWNSCINSLREIARRILSDESRLNEGAIEIVTLLHKLPSPLSCNPDFASFHALSSETTHLPLPHVRVLWSEASLVRADKELEEIEERYYESIKKSSALVLTYDFDGFRNGFLKVGAGKL